MLKDNLKMMMAALVLFIGVSNAPAQVDADTVLRVHVNDAFMVNKELLPAGDYTIQRTPLGIDSPTLLVIRGEKKTVIFDTMLAQSATPAKNTSLVFKKIDGVDHLSAIVVEGDTVSNELTN